MEIIKNFVLRHIFTIRVFDPPNVALNVLDLLIAVSDQRQRFVEQHLTITTQRKTH